MQFDDDNEEDDFDYDLEIPSIEEEVEFQMRKCVEALSLLCDSVQINATTYDRETDTTGIFHYGSGNECTRLDSCREFINMVEQIREEYR